MGSKTNYLAAVLVLCAALGLVACASEERAPAEDGDDRAVTRTVTVTEAAPSEKTGTVEASAEPPSPCGTTPQRVLELQYRHINEGEYESAYAFFAEQSQTLVTPAQYRAFFEENAPYSVTDYSFPSVDVAGETATVGIEFTATSGGVPERLSRTQELVCEMGSWRVVMREEQVAAFAGAGQEAEQEEAAQYDPPEPEESPYDATATVTRVVDGDTIEVSPAVDGNEEVRLIGVDTPETKDPNEEVEPYGPEASTFAASELEGREIGLEFDAERTDRYGRLLAYVHLDGEMFNETLVEEGYAQVWFIPPNTLHEGELLAAQEGARASFVGIWGLPPDQQCLLANHGNGIGEGEPGCVQEQQPQYEPAPQYEPEPRPAPSAPAVPGGDVDCSDFSSSLEAQSYLLPGDPYRLDADGDGQACDSLD